MVGRGWKVGKISHSDEQEQVEQGAKYCEAYLRQNQEASL